MKNFIFIALFLMLVVGCSNPTSPDCITSTNTSDVETVFITSDSDTLGAVSLQMSMTVTSLNDLSFTVSASIDTVEAREIFGIRFRETGEFTSIVGGDISSFFNSDFENEILWHNHKPALPFDGFNSGHVVGTSKIELVNGRITWIFNVNNLENEVELLEAFSTDSESYVFVGLRTPDGLKDFVTRMLNKFNRINS